MAIRNRKKLGSPPGSVIFTGKQKMDEVLIHYLEYNEEKFKKINPENQSIEAFHHPTDEFVQWYDIRGLHDVAIINNIGTTFKLHPLILEDIVDTQQRPKYDEYDDGIIIILKALSFDTETNTVKTEQVSIYLGQGFLLSFQENKTDLFHLVRDRVHAGKGRIRRKNADYLIYALLDSIMDHYYTVLDEIELVIEKLESSILNKPNQNSKGEIHHLKQEMLTVRKTIAPLREAISRFSKSEHDLISDNTKVFLRDLYDHNVQLLDTTETYRDMLNSLQDLYLSEISFKMNQVMQMLTLITSVFVPLSFLAGLYGMNFEYIPELQVKYGYFVLIGVMFLIGGSMLYFFKRKNWF